VAFSAKDFGADATENLSPTLRAGGFNTSHANSGNWMAIQTAMQVRRITPREGERLQGFQWKCSPEYPGAWQDDAGIWWTPDYTLINYRGKPAADGPRYKALGNSMAVPVMRKIGQRIQLVSDVIRMKVAA
jgi:DNA (cytosine-5)-methyltransferase 1